MLLKEEDPPPMAPADPGGVPGPHAWHDEEHEVEALRPTETRVVRRKTAEDDERKQRLLE